MHVAVTGALGYIAGHLVRALGAAGHEVTGLVRPGRVGPGQVGWDEDVDPLALAEGLAGVDVVVHLGARYVRVHRPADVGPLVRANVEAGARLLEAARLAGVRRIITTGTWFPPDANLYAATRAAFRALLDGWAAWAPFEVVELVVHDVYGPDDHRPRLLPALLRAQRGGPPVELVRGAGALDLVHVDDVVAAYVGALSGPTGAFAVRTGAPVTLPALVGLLEALGGPIPHRWIEAPPGPCGRPVAWPTPPGWSARPLSDGLRSLVAGPSTAG